MRVLRTSTRSMLGGAMLPAEAASYDIGDVVEWGISGQVRLATGARLTAGVVIEPSAGGMVRVDRPDWVWFPFADAAETDGGNEIWATGATTLGRTGAVALGIVTDVQPGVAVQVLLDYGIGAHSGGLAGALGPETNEFGDATTADRATAEGLRDTYAAANATWLAAYNQDQSFYILLTWSGTTGQLQRRNLAGDAWEDATGIIVGPRGPSGDVNVKPYARIGGDLIARDDLGPSAGLPTYSAAGLSYDPTTATIAGNITDVPDLRHPAKMLFIVPAGVDRQNRQIVLEVSGKAANLRTLNGARIAARDLIPGSLQEVLVRSGEYRIIEPLVPRPQDFVVHMLTVEFPTRMAGDYDFDPDQFVLTQEILDGTAPQGMFDILTDGQTDRGLRVTLAAGAGRTGPDSNGYNVTIQSGAVNGVTVDDTAETITVMVVSGALQSAVKAVIDADAALSSEYFGAEDGTGTAEDSGTPTIFGGAHPGLSTMSTATSARVDWPDGFQYARAFDAANRFTEFTNVWQYIGVPEDAPNVRGTAYGTTEGASGNVTAIDADERVAGTLMTGGVAHKFVRLLTQPSGSGTDWAPLRNNGQFYMVAFDGLPDPLVP